MERTAAQLLRSTLLGDSDTPSALRLAFPAALAHFAVMAIPRLRRWVVVSSLGMLAIAIVALMFANVIPDRALTKSAMTETSVRIGMFVDQNKQLPLSLTPLPRREGYANRVVDAWKRPLIYVVNSQDRFTLTSLGRDGVVGGTGDDVDIIQKYRVIDRNVRREP